MEKNVSQSKHIPRGAAISSGAKPATLHDSRIAHDSSSSDSDSGTSPVPAVQTESAEQHTRTAALCTGVSASTSGRTDDTGVVSASQTGTYVELNPDALFVICFSDASRVTSDSGYTVLARVHNRSYDDFSSSMRDGVATSSFLSAGLRCSATLQPRPTTAKSSRSGVSDDEIVNESNGLGERSNSTTVPDETSRDQLSDRWLKTTLRSCSTLCLSLRRTGYGVCAVMIQQVTNTVLRILFLDGLLSYTDQQLGYIDQIVTNIASGIPDVARTVLLETSIAEVSAELKGTSSKHGKTFIREACTEVAPLRSEQHQSHLRNFTPLRLYCANLDELRTLNEVKPHTPMWLPLRSLLRLMLRLQRENRPYLCELIFYATVQFCDAALILEKQYCALSPSQPIRVRSAMLSHHVSTALQGFFDILNEEHQFSEASIAEEAYRYEKASVQLDPYRTITSLSPPRHAHDEPRTDRQATSDAKKTLHRSTVGHSSSGHVQKHSTPQQLHKSNENTFELDTHSNDEVADSELPRQTCLVM